MRYVYGTFRTHERAADALEEECALGNVSQGERPRLEPKRDHRQRIVAWQITLAA